jgi:hypothetical protein
MADKSKKLVIITLISIIANIILFFVMIGLIAANALEIGVSEIVVSISGIILLALWPLINLTLSVFALVFSIKGRKTCIPLAIIDLALSIAGPALYAFTYLMDYMYRGF